ncbi:MAG: ABC transporter ATP-binding protein [Chthoniobacterales bacterium]|nr:ABC transporter ATP-binding protein [Chthoniobacterales bacterium]
MAREVVIRAEGLSKKYLLGQKAGSAGGLRHVIEDAAASPFRLAKRVITGKTPRLGSEEAEFWALQDVTFDVRRGDVVGIIGRNGAGKSTLLKVLSRITEPTRGRIGLKGRVASLLEVGTGFHPELTGRENVYLNGAVLGMRQAEVRQKFDEIVAFAGVEQFLDTPVKRYSSGMYVRLAFAVAAHLEPEILIVDEVLAVGDSEFQKKCLDKMREVTDGGRTVLFVSHNLSAVAALCDRAIYLKAGRLLMAGESGPVIERYQSDVTHAGDAPASNAAFRSGSGTHRIEEIRPAGSDFSPRSPMEFRVRIRQHAPEGPFHFSMHFRDEWDVEVFAINSESLEGITLQPGDQEALLRISSPWLPPGDYRADAYLHRHGIIDHWPDACRFHVGADVAVRGYSAASAKNAGKALADFTLRIARPEAGT